MARKRKETLRNSWAVGIKGDRIMIVDGIINNDKIII